MGVEFVEEGERLIARPRGRMEADDGAGFASAVEQRLHAGTKAVTIELDELEFLSLGSIRAILRLGRSLKRGDRTLDFVRGSGPVREALHQAGLNHFFGFTPPYESHRGTPT
jgi:anti-anti-sigma regulatory factor